MPCYSVLEQDTQPLPAHVREDLQKEDSEMAQSTNDTEQC